MKTFNFDVLEIKDFSVQTTGTKNFYNLDGKKNYLDEIKSVSQFNSPLIDFPNMYGPLNFREDGSGVFFQDSLGYFVSEGDTVESNPSLVFLLSGPSYRNRGININKSNFLYVTSYFSARLSIPSNWQNQKDSYIFSPQQIEDGEVFDTVIYSLFNNSSYQSSARSIIHNENFFDIKNHFFWISCEDVKKMSDNLGYDELYNDARISENRFVYNFLYGPEKNLSKLSKTALNVLELANNLFESSLALRQEFSNSENQLNCWDAGYAQLKNLWKEFFPNEFKNFRKEYKILENKMTERVYRLCFLK